MRKAKTNAVINHSQTVHLNLNQGIGNICPVTPSELLLTDDCCAASFPLSEREPLGGASPISKPDYKSLALESDPNVINSMIIWGGGIVLRDGVSLFCM